MRSTGNAIKAYSNAGNLTLTVNGAVIGSQSNGAYTIPEGTPIHNVFFWPDCLQQGRNVVTVRDENGNSDSGTIYFIGTTTKAPPNQTEYISKLTSSNGAAVFVNSPVTADWAIYYQCDGNADNTFKDIPTVLKDARWIATARVSTDLSFTISSHLAKGTTVYYMTSATSGPFGFTDTGIKGLWRNNELNRVSYKLYSRVCAAAANVKIPGSLWGLTEHGLSGHEPQSVSGRCY